jgi:hypothetical protein
MGKGKATGAGNTERRNAETAKSAKGMQRKIPPRVQQYINRQGTDG